MQRALKLLVLLMAAVLSCPAFAKTPPVPFRGVVEGYYGRPWGTEGRLSLLKFMGENDLNVFIYGPKDDPYHHEKWREPYPAAEMKAFTRLLTCAKANRVNLYWAIHLGGSFKKGSDDDYAALFRKLNLMYDGGFRSFAVFFDDFGGADATFHAEICNRIQREFLDRQKDCAPLIMCPNVYSGTGKPYQKTLGAALDRRVNIMWTGRGVCSDITADAVRQITADFQRPPYIWWNWPVNDYCRGHLLLGRTYGIDTCTYAGFVANPMENCEASKIALYGVAKWCHDPDGFDSQKVFEETFPKLYKDPAVAKAMRVFAEHNADPGETVHKYRREESVAAAPLCAKAREELAANGKLSPATAAELRKLFNEVGRASRTLTKKLPKTRYDLGWEIEGWLDAETALMAQGVLALDLAEATVGSRVPRDRDSTASLLKRLKAIRRQADAAAERHREKFAEATFTKDKERIKRPDPSARELAPTVSALLETSLRRLYEKRTGKTIVTAKGFEAFSNARSLPKLFVSLEESRFAGLVRIMEPKDVRAGESFGLHLPDKWQADYFHAKLGSDAPARAGVIELSKDGKTWTRLETKNEGQDMQAKLDPKALWHWARYRNTSAKTVSVKLNLFKFDIRGGGSAIDELVDALCADAAVCNRGQKML